MGSGTSSTCGSDKSVEIKSRPKGISIPIRRPSAILNAEMNTRHLTINPAGYQFPLEVPGGTVNGTNAGNNLPNYTPKKNKNRLVRNQKNQKAHFEIFKADNGEEYTIFRRTDSCRFYINCITQEWKPVDSSWFNHGTFYVCEQHEAEQSYLRCKLLSEERKKQDLLDMVDLLQRKLDGQEVNDKDEKLKVKNPIVRPILPNDNDDVDIRSERIGSGGSMLREKIALLEDKLELTMCKVCFENELEIVLCPCKHMVTCTSCAEQLIICPTCRAPIIARDRVYRS